MGTSSGFSPERALLRTRTPSSPGLEAKERGSRDKMPLVF